MKPVILIRVSPDQNSDYAEVIMSVSGVAEDGKEYWVRLYEQQRLAQQLPDTMAVEPWALAAISEHSDAIRAALAGMINRGQKTLMVDTWCPKEK